MRLLNENEMLAVAGGADKPKRPPKPCPPPPRPEPPPPDPYPPIPGPIIEPPDLSATIGGD